MGEEEIRIKKSELKETIDRRVEKKLQARQKVGEIVKNKEQTPKNISRREFLKKAGLGTVGLGALFSPVSAEYFIKDDQFTVKTSDDGGSTLNQGLTVNQDQSVDIPNANLNLDNNNIERVNQINGQDTDNLGGSENPVWSEPHDDAPDDLSQVHEQMKGSGTEEDPYRITNDHELQAMQHHLSSHYKLTKNIDCSKTQNWNNGNGFEPISKFNGKLNGGDNIVQKLYVDRANDDYVGLFGQIDEDCNINDIGLKQVYINGDGGSTSDGGVGALVGYSYKGTVSNCHVTGKIEGSVEGIGGLVGTQYRASMNYCYAHCEVDAPNAERVGTLVGHTWYSSVSNCYANGAVHGGEDVGGLVGNCNNGNSSLTRCYSAADVTGDTNVAGLCGSGNSGVFKFCYARGSVSGGSGVAGLIASGMDGFGSGDIEGVCYWDTQATGQDDEFAEGSDEDAIGLETSEMQGSNAVSNIDFDFEGIWFANSDYPALRWEVLKLS